MSRETDTKRGEEKESIARIEDEDMRDIEVLRTVLSVITEFLQSLKTPLKELLGTITEAVRGDVVGRDVGEFYRQLKSAGLPEDLVTKMTESYLKARLEAVPTIKNLTDAIASAIRERTKPGSE